MLNLLTEREREVLVLIGECYGNAEIAKRLFISPRTVERHITAIMEKTGVQGKNPVYHTRARLVRLADRMKADALSNEFAVRLIASRRATAEEVA